MVALSQTNPEFTPVFPGKINAYAFLFHANFTPAFLSFHDWIASTTGLPSSDPAYIQQQELGLNPRKKIALKIENENIVGFQK